MRCDVMRCDAMRCNAMRRDATRCDAMRYDAMLYLKLTCIQIFPGLHNCATLVRFCKSCQKLIHLNLSFTASSFLPVSYESAKACAVVVGESNDGEQQNALSSMGSSSASVASDSPTVIGNYHLQEMQVMQ
jgi:hypothetical protein